MNHKSVALRKKTKLRFIRSCNKIIHTVKNHDTVTPHQLKSMQSYLGILTWVSSDDLRVKYQERVERVICFGIDAL